MNDSTSKYKNKIKSIYLYARLRLLSGHSLWLVSLTLPTDHSLFITRKYNLIFRIGHYPTVGKRPLPLGIHIDIKTITNNSHLSVLNK